MATPYKNPTEAATALGAAFNPTGNTLTPAQITAINQASSLVPTITSASVTPTPQIQIPPQQSYTSPVLPSIDDLVKAASVQNPALQTEQTDLMKGIQDLLGQQGGEATRRMEIEAQQGLPQKQQQLDEINARINEMTAQAKQAEVTSEGRQAPTFSIYGEQAQINRQLSSQTFGLAAAASALTNQISRAQDYVSKAIDAEFGGIESQLKYQTTLLDLNRDKMTREEQERADTLKIQLQERERILGEQKTEKKGVYDVMTTAAQNGADNATLERIRNSKTREEALQNAGRFMMAPVKASAPQTKTYTYGGKVYSYQVDSSGAPITAPQEVGGSVKKGNLSDANFVERVLNDKGVSYQDVLDKIPEGKIGVIENSTGDIGAIDPDEYDPKVYTYL